MSNHLIIGLGGTGGSVIRSLRKRIYQEFGELDPAGNSTNVDYIYVDSSPADLNDTEKWKTLGASVQLAPAQKGWQNLRSSHQPISWKKWASHQPSSSI